MKNGILLNLIKHEETLNSFKVRKWFLISSIYMHQSSHTQGSNWQEEIRFWDLKWRQSFELVTSKKYTTIRKLNIDYSLNLILWPNYFDVNQHFECYYLKSPQFKRLCPLQLLKSIFGNFGTSTNVRISKKNNLKVVFVLRISPKHDGLEKIQRNNLDQLDFLIFILLPCQK